LESFETLFNKAQNGDMVACSQIARRFQNMARAYAYAHLGDVHLSEDAVQEAFIETFLNLSSVYGPASFPSFLRKVIFKHCDRILRKQRTDISLDALPELTSGHDPAQDLENQENQNIIHKALMSLPLKERQVITLFYIGGHKRREIAQFLDLPLETVIYRLRSARERFQKGKFNMKHKDLINQPAQKAGKTAFAEIDVENIDPELAEHLGNLKTVTSNTPERDNILLHSLEVAHLAGLIAAELDLDVATAQRAGLLHDLGKSISDGKTHIQAGMDLSEQFGEHPIVHHVIATHHDKNDCLSPYTFAVKAADYLSTQKTPPALENSTPQVIDLQAIADSHENIRSAHAIHVSDELWILIRGDEDVDREALNEEIQKMLNFEGKTQITVAREIE